MTRNPDTPEAMTPFDAAAYLVTELEGKGGVFALDADGYLHTDLSLVGPEPDEGLVHLVFALRDEIKAILRARKVLH